MRASRLIRALLAVALGAMLTIVHIDTATAAPKVGYLRLAHLSPDTPDVDVYVSTVGGDDDPQVFPGVGYGTVSAYLPLPVGTYAVAMRAPGAPASAKPILTTSVEVAAGRSYTVAGVGSHADLGLRVVTDDLRAPAAGQARLRVVQASLKALQLRVTVADGPVIASSVAFPDITDYRNVPAGDRVVRLRPLPSGGTTTINLQLVPGSVYSLFVLDGTGGIRAQLRADASGGSVIPVGGVETGGGGSTAPAPRWPFLTLAALVLGLVAALAGRHLYRTVAR